MTGGKRQFKLPLDTCPEEFLSHYIGDCQECFRPMASNRLMRRTPELKKWFMHANNGRLCRACYSHGKEGVSQRKRDQSRKLSPDLVWWLRAETGACLTCGWLPDEPDEDGTMEGHGDRDCLAVEPRSPSGNDHLRETG